MRVCSMHVKVIFKVNREYVEMSSKYTIYVDIANRNEDYVHGQ